MTTQEKNEIKNGLKVFIAQNDSPEVAAQKLNLSPATLSRIIQGKSEQLPDEVWRTVGVYIGWNPAAWTYVSTRSFQLIQLLLEDAQRNSEVFAFVGESGLGKTAALKAYALDHSEAFLIRCSEYWNRKYFLGELLKQLGRDQSGLNVSEMMEEVIRTLKALNKPLILLDEADKLPDPVLYFFITLYNELESTCGIVLCATDHLEKRIHKGLKINKKGYKEIYSRIGRKFIEISGVVLSDIVQICLSNGISEGKVQREIHLEAQGDLRRVRRKIHAIRNSQLNQN